MILSSPTITSDNTINNSIDQLHEITTQQQNAINSIQATLSIQQNDIDNIKTTIVDIRTSINHMIHSVSEIATKLGFEITLPPPLPIPRTPPTSPHVAAASFTTPSFPLDHIISDSASPALVPTKSETAILANRQPITLQPLLPTPNPSPSAQFLRSLSLLSTSVVVPASKLTNNLPKSLSIASFSSTQTHSSILFIAYQGISGAYGEAAISEAYLICKTLIGIKNKLRCESKVYIFDPGGLFDIVCIFDIPTNCQAIPQQQVTFESDTVSKPEIRKLILQPFVFSKGILHLKFDENYSNAISKHGFQVPDVYLPDLNNRKLYLSRSVNKMIDFSMVILRSELEAASKYDPFEIVERDSSSKSNEPIQSLNSYGLFYFEILRPMKAEEDSEDRFRFHADSSPYGPQSIYYDFSVHGTEFVYDSYYDLCCLILSICMTRLLDLMGVNYAL